MDTTQSEHWRYTVRPGQADGVFLVIDSPTLPSRWIAMQPCADRPGVWSASAQITPGLTRVRYFIADGGAYLNCGNTGLHGQPLAAGGARNASGLAVPA